MERRTKDYYSRQRHKKKERKKRERKGQRAGARECIFCPLHTWPCVEEQIQEKEPKTPSVLRRVGPGTFSRTVYTIYTGIVYTLVYKKKGKKKEGRNGLEGPGFTRRNVEFIRSRYAWALHTFLRLSLLKTRPMHVCAFTTVRIAHTIHVLTKTKLGSCALSASIAQTNQSLTVLVS